MIEILSYIGMVFLLIGFALTRKRPIKDTVLSLIGGVTMALWGLLTSAIAVFILNTAWSFIGVYTLKKYLEGRKKNVRVKNKVLKE